MIKKAALILITVIMASSSASNKEYKKVEVFDISKGYVIEEVQSSMRIQGEVKDYLNKITGIYGKFRPIPDKGYMIKIPLDYPYTVKNEYIDAFIDEVIIIFPESEKPYLMIFDNEERPFFLSFDGNTDMLLKKMNIKL